MTADELHSLVLTSYTLTDEDIDTLTQALAQGYLVSMMAAYREGASTVNATKDAREWEPSDKAVDEAMQWASEQAKGIAHTYEDMLTRWVQQIVEEQGTEKALWPKVSIEAQSVAAGLKAGISAFMGWKPKQVANATCGSGADDGTDALVSDMQDGTVMDASTNQAVDMTQYGVTVLPPESSSDVCKTVAGLVFDLDQYDEIIDLPAHSNCPHYKKIIQI